MDHSNQTYTLVKGLRDNESLDINQIEYYRLSIILGCRDLQILITDTRNVRCLLLEDYVLKKTETSEEHLAILKQIFENHQLLNVGFWHSIKVSIKNKLYSLIPTNDFDEEHLSEYLTVSTTANLDSDELFFTKLKSFDFYNVFAVPKEIKNFFTLQYPCIPVTFEHHSNLLINTAGSTYIEEEKEYKKMFLYVDRFILHLMVLEGEKVHFYNQFKINKFEDYIKYIDLISKQLNISTIVGEMTIWGFIGTKTSHYRQLQRHIPNLNFGTKPEEVKLSYKFDELEKNQYRDIFELCNS